MRRGGVPIQAGRQAGLLLLPAAASEVSLHLAQAAARRPALITNAIVARKVTDMETSKQDVAADMTKTHLRAIEGLNRTVIDRRTAWENAKAAAAAYKKEYDGAVEELTELISEGKPAPLFDAASES